MDHNGSSVAVDTCRILGEVEEKEKENEGLIGEVQEKAKAKG
jgi:hypothetical protein